MSLSVSIKKSFPAFTLDVDIEAGNETIGWLGESGCGKSLTMRLSLIHIFSCMSIVFQPIIDKDNLRSITNRRFPNSFASRNVDGCDASH